MLALRHQIVIFAAERNDSDGRWLSGHLADVVTLQTGAVDRVLDLKGAAIGLYDSFSATSQDAGHFRSQPDHPALSGNQFGVLGANRHIVSNACGRDVQPRYTPTVRFKLPGL